MFALITSTDFATVMVAVCGLAAAAIPVTLSFQRSGAARDAAQATNAQMSNNGGASLRDAIDRMERSIDRVETGQFDFDEKWERRFTILDHRIKRIETAASTAQLAAVTAKEVVVTAVTAAVQGEIK